MNSKTNLNKISGNLQKIILGCRSQKDAFNFLWTLFTPKEILELSQRLDLATRLHKGQSYKKIEEETGASSTTIARAAKFLKGKIGVAKKAKNSLG